MKKEKVSRSEFVPIVGDGGIACSDVGEGRFIPVLILDCANKKDLYDLILIHGNTPPGDVTTTWALRRFDKKHIYLKLEFARPAVVVAYISFTLEKYAGLVEGIMKSRAVYLQPQQSGSKVIEGIDKPKIVVEVTSKLDKWPSIYCDAVETKYRKAGHGRKQAKVLAREYMSRSSELWSRRMHRSPSADT